MRNFHLVVIVFGLLILFTLSNIVFAGNQAFDIVVAGGGTGGTVAAVQAAKLSSRVALLEETQWIGGMITSAGVSAIDMKADDRSKFTFSTGLYREIEKRIHYEYCDFGNYPCPNNENKLGRGSTASNGTAFEPQIALKVLRNITDLVKSNLTIFYNTTIIGVLKNGNKVIGVMARNATEQFNITANVTIDSTEYGDVIAMAGAAYSIGRETNATTGEPHALCGPQRPECPGGPNNPDNYTQAFAMNFFIRNYTYNVDIYGNPNDTGIGPPPADYSASKYELPWVWYQLYDGFKIDSWVNKTVNKTGYLQYQYAPNSLFTGDGRFQNYSKKYNIYPNFANDFAYDSGVFLQCSPNKVTVVQMNSTERTCLINKARNHSLGYLFFLKNHTDSEAQDAKKWGIFNEFNSSDGLALIPYIRESRRLVGLDRLFEQNISDSIYPNNETGRGSRYNNSIAIGEFNIDIIQARPERYKAGSRAVCPSGIGARY
ncbi:MAG: FAD-dependent oxidoreductase [Candidatus Omnitrophica bacterium]|nr:FAD-dependent oxidoreductase [Candidatus Omnitrophota bacterium]